MVQTEHFFTYEDLLDYLDLKTGFSPPRIIEGKKMFLNKFNKWFSNFDDNETSHTEWRCIFPDPSLNISYPYPIDEIAVAISIGENRNKDVAQTILNAYHLDESISKRQTITLSGGELLLLSFAKAEAFKPYTNRLFICTPTQWLHQTKYFLLENLIRLYDQEEREVILLLLEGEEYLNASDIKSSGLKSEKKIKEKDKNALPWSLTLNDLKIEFEEQLFPKVTPAHLIQYIPSNLNIELDSPTLVTGDNGVGKSIFVKILCGIIKPDKGSVIVRCLGNEGNARMLMQDSLDQLFGETIESHFSRVFKYDKERGKKTKNLYSTMLERLREKVSTDKKLRSLCLTTSDSNLIETVLQVKFALVAERIESRPPLLILDEPDWCLSKSLTRLFIEIVVETAHSYKIPVLIITHLNDWYAELYNSRLEFKKSKDNGSVKIKRM